MIVIHTSYDCGQCKDIERSLDEMVMDYDIDASAKPSGGTAGRDDHSMEDGEDVFRGHEEMRKHVAQLNRINQQWREGGNECEE